MTPKDKAREIFNKMYLVDDPMGNYPMCFDTAKQCALISVDEIIGSHYKIFTGVNNLTLEYWTDVKQQIEKL
jgi:hypothetical protein